MANNKANRSKRPWFEECQLSAAERQEIKAQLRAFETEALKRKYKKKTTDALNSDASKAARKVLKRLKACTSEDPCGTSACDDCMALIRLWYAHNTTRILTPYQEQGCLFQLTYVPARARLAPDKLLTLDLPRLAHRTQRQLRDAIPGAIIVGGIDISFNEHAYAKWDPHFQPHATVLVGGVKKSVIKAAYGKLPGEYGPGSHKPFHATAVTDLPYAATYGLKMRFARRITFRTSTEPTEHAFRSWQQAQMSIILNGIGLDDRLILCRSKRQGGYLIDLLKRH